ncbi:hypothetical protein HKX48_000510 [Thoreauomyces humboldtii]|nr:hypothetical protein HKX48_000510 [Thoreauomyces humboldtii]
MSISQSASPSASNGGGRGSNDPVIDKGDPKRKDSRKDSVAPSTIVAQKRRWCRIPLALLLLVTTTLVAAAIVVPVAVLAYQGANDTVDDILTVLRRNYALQCHEKITSEFATVYDLVRSNSNNLAIRRPLDLLTTGSTINFTAHPDIILSYEQSVASSDFAIAAGFFVKGLRDTVLVPQPGQPGILCTADNGATDGFDCYTLNINPTDGLNLSFYFTDFGSNKSTIQSWPSDYGGVWDVRPRFIHLFADVFLGILTFYWPQWTGLEIGTTPPSSTIETGSQIVIISFDVLSTLLATIQTTANTAIGLWFTVSGQMLASNKGGTVLDPSTYTLSDYDNAASYVAQDFADPYIAAAATQLRRVHGDYSLWPASTSDTFKGVDDVGTIFVESRQIADEQGLNLTILIVIPEQDLLGPMYASRRKVIITSVAIGIGMLGFATATSILVSRPLRRLTTVMVAATGMDFSALRSGYLDRTSAVVELARMQEVFGTMLARFAGAIDTNRRLMGRTNRSGPGDSSVPPSSVPQSSVPYSAVATTQREAKDTREMIERV